jgi:hypothetical protein
VREEKETKVDMLKVLDTYKKSVDYFNSFGLEGSSKTARSKKQDEEGRAKTNTFWDY